MSDMHMSRLAGWLLQTIGKALAVSLLAAAVVGVAAAAFAMPALLWLSAIVGPLVFAAMLYNASAPLPDFADEDAEV